MLPRQSSAIVLLFACVIAASTMPVQADTLQLQPDHPERYVVTPGDTLWDIANRFLRSPWLWPRVWKINEHIANPHLIYPGDVLMLTYVDGQPQLQLLRNGKLSPGDTEPAPEPGPDGTTAAPTTPGRTLPSPNVSGVTRLQPTVRSEPLPYAIPTLSPDVISPFLTQPLAIEKKYLKDSGYITVGLDDRIALGNLSKFYARGMKKMEGEYFYIFRIGEPLRNPDNGEILAYEAMHLGDALMLQPGDPAKLQITRVTQEISPKDRLLPADTSVALPYYYPHPAPKGIKARIAAAHNAVSEIGPFQAIVLNVGKEKGVEEGHIFRVLRHAGKHKDPVSRSNYALPDEESGLAMVFRVFDRVSYALIMRATLPIHIGDTVVAPE